MRESEESNLNQEAMPIHHIPINPTIYHSICPYVLVVENGGFLLYISLLNGRGVRRTLMVAALHLLGVAAPALLSATSRLAF